MSEKSLFQSHMSPFQKISFTTYIPNHHNQSRRKYKPFKPNRRSEPMAIIKNQERLLELLIDLQNFDQQHGTSLFQKISLNKMQHFLNGNINFICSLHNFKK